ncbi:response regulator [Methylobacterium brachythecii]|nr:response regulator [Methylobacterium brachythecii]
MQKEYVSRHRIVLLVEDEALLRVITTEMLEDTGATVIGVETADAAWQILQTRSDVDIVFTDVNMPGSMNGVVLAHRVRERWPHIALVITSGRHLLSEAEIPARGHFLPKPYRYQQIVGAMELAAPRQ